MTRGLDKTCILISPRYMDHDPGPSHPENPRRMRAIEGELKKSNILNEKSCCFTEPEPASIEDLKLIHEEDYVRLVERVCASGGGTLDLGDTVVSTKSFDVARLAAGGALKAVEKVMKGECRNAFALVRPPGHHAGPYYGMGFCIFNNVALAAAHLLTNLDLKRVVILDIDAHHGNGTQEIFYETSKVLYISLHQDPRDFPGTGFADETGKGDGLGYTVNIPLPFQTGDSAYWRAIKELAIPIVCQYEPEFILISAGFDGYYGDTVASLSLSASIYPRIFDTITSLAHELCYDRVAAILEGGYRLAFLGKAAVAAVARMAGLKYEVSDDGPPLNLEAQRAAEKIIETVRSIHSSFWSL